MTDRMQVVRRFQEDPGVRVFVGSITAAGVGITLTASSRVVFAELDWVPGNVTQAEDRVHRIGQAESVLVQHLVLQGSLDAHMAQVLIEKQQVADDALDTEHERGTPAVPGAAGFAKPKAYPSVGEGERVRLEAAVRALAEEADRLQEAGTPLPRYDARIARGLAAAVRMTDGQAWLAGRLVVKHGKALAGS